MTSKLTREQLEEWVAQFDEDGGCDATDMQLEALIRQSLAAMDSEPVEMPLDYLQGHKDGLEWAAQLAEANHPETGDWLYDDPIELAKAIRKGPDMPPVQPVADSEPDRNPVLAYADSYRDMAKQGVESVPIWSVITDLERNIAPLYRHAQPAPVVPDEYVAPAMTPTNLAYEAGWNACRAAMLQELKKSAGTEATCRSNENVQAVEVQSLTSINPAPELVSFRKKAESIIGNYLGIPDGSEHCPCCGKKLRRTCSVEGCGGKHVAHGLCQKHYDMQRWEDPEQVERFREAGRRYRGKKKSTVATPQEPKP